MSITHLIPGDRFVIKRRIGEGSSGVVYEAFDQERRARVALKTLSSLDPRGVSEIKDEFRSLAGVVHPNLVGLHELIAHDGRWFFTMDYVEGVPFVEARGKGAAAGSEPWESPLRDALRQLATGIDTLHRAGKLHCDLKPSNVLVTASGRVIILDFGLVREVLVEELEDGARPGVSGTPAYMAPEQARGDAPATASDWYAFGVMLYEALCGELPFDGNTQEVLFAKQHVDPLPPSKVVAGVPADLDQLCIELLRRDPADRPRGDEVLRRIEGDAPAGGAAPRKRAAAPRKRAAAPGKHAALPFVGREHPLRLLREAFTATLAGKPVVVHVQGPSGIGKTTLVERFLEGVGDDIGVDAVILRGRCHEHESIPYKAFDCVIDALGRYLGNLPARESAGLIPREVHLLCRLFPVLSRIEAVDRAPYEAPDIPDEQELRQRAFAALKQLLKHITDKQPLVIAIDDLQWGDLDSARLVAQLLAEPLPPALLLLACYRSEDTADSAFLTELRSRFAEVSGRDRKIELGPLSSEESERLAAGLLDRRSSAAPAARAMAQESGGHPYFLTELIREMAARTGDAGRAGKTPSLRELIRDRVDRLRGDSSRLLELLAAAGHPLAQGLALEAAGLGEGGHRVLALLRSQSLVRTQGPRADDAVEIYHDRIGETVREGLHVSQSQAYHRSLALALERAPGPDPEALAIHFDAAGERERAGAYFVAAADAAASSLAFDHAATLYRKALATNPKDEREKRDLRNKLGRALENAGRGAEAGHEYRAAAAGHRSHETLELRRRAADQLLNSGLYEEGLQVLLPLLDDLGLRYPATPRRAVASLALRFVQLRLRGTRFRERNPSEIPPRELLRIDALEAAGRGLEFTDLLRSISFYARHAILALKAGEPLRVAHGLANLSPADPKLGDVAEAIAVGLEDPRAMALVLMWRGVASYLRGNWKTGLESLDRAADLLRRCVGVARDRRYCEMKSMICLLHLGELRELSCRGEAHVSEAIDRGDRILEYAGRLLSTTIGFIARDEPERARHELRSVQAPGHSVLRLFQAHALTELELYGGDAAAARAHWQQTWPLLERSELFRMGFFLVWAARSRACAALAAGGDAALREADRLAGMIESAPVVRMVERAKLPTARPSAESIRAGIAASRGDAKTAARLLQSSAAGYDGAAMKLYAEACRHRLGTLIGGAQGRALVEAAGAAMREEGIASPVRWTSMYVPGFEGPFSG